MFAGKRSKVGAAIFLSLFFFIWAMELDLFARVGGGTSSGSRGSRSYSSPSSPYSSTSPSSQSSSPSQPMSPQTQQPSIWRSLGMGMAGGFLGSLLFGGMGMGGFNGSGIGLLEIILISGLLYFLYSYLRRRKQAESAAGTYYQTGASSAERQTSFSASPQYQGFAETDVQTGIGHIRQLDASFDEARFSDLSMDNFFKIQGAWINRDMASVKDILTEEMFGILQRDADKLRAEKKINKLDNIAVRSVEITEAWQEGGIDFITVRFLASLLDYTVSDSGELLSGSKTEPVKFEEYWTFTRPAGNNRWQLSAINQAQ
ncbi:MAG TPA: Tim44 domain-containing protein [Syntrophales bacterium]|nr:Tim44 domain-containing protein [Syntrophales bacterium]